MTFTDKVRGCDQFGASISLNYQGGSTFRMIGGGLASIALKLLIFTFFCMQLMAVVTYKDPQVSNFEVMESRAYMDEPINLAASNFSFYIGVIAVKTSMLLREDPRYGTFRLTMQK